MVRLTAATDVIERTVGSLKGVEGVKVVQSPLGEIEEIHVLVDAERSPKQAVRDVESVLLAKLGIEIDHRKISVAQLNLAPMKPPKSTEGRLKFVEAGISTRRNRMEAYVGLERDGEVFTAKAEGVYSAGDQYKLVSQATVGAVQQAGYGDASLAVVDVARLDLGGKDIVVAVVKEVKDGSETTFTGAAICRQDVYRAAVNATLSALNRRVVRGS